MLKGIFKQLGSFDWGTQRTWNDVYLLYCENMFCAPLINDEKNYFPHLSDDESLRINSGTAVIMGMDASISPIHYRHIADLSLYVNKLDGHESLSFVKFGMDNRLLNSENQQSKLTAADSAMHMSESRDLSSLKHIRRVTVNSVRCTPVETECTVTLHPKQPDKPFLTKKVLYVIGLILNRKNVFLEQKEAYIMEHISQYPKYFQLTDNNLLVLELSHLPLKLKTKVDHLSQLQSTIRVFTLMLQYSNFTHKIDTKKVAAILSRTFSSNRNIFKYYLALLQYFKQCIPEIKYIVYELTLLVRSKQGKLQFRKLHRLNPTLNVSSDPPISINLSVVMQWSSVRDKLGNLTCEITILVSIDSSCQKGCKMLAAALFLFTFVFAYFVYKMKFQFPVSLTNKLSCGLGRPKSAAWTPYECVVEKGDPGRMVISCSNMLEFDKNQKVSLPILKSQSIDAMIERYISSEVLDSLVMLLICMVTESLLEKACHNMLLSESILSEKVVSHAIIRQSPWKCRFLSDKRLLGERRTESKSVKLNGTVYNKKMVLGNTLLLCLGRVTRGFLVAALPQQNYYYSLNVARPYLSSLLFVVKNTEAVIRDQSNWRSDLVEDAIDHWSPLATTLYNCGVSAQAHVSYHDSNMWPTGFGSDPVVSGSLETSLFCRGKRKLVLQDLKTSHIDHLPPGSVEPPEPAPQVVFNNTIIKKDSTPLEIFEDYPDENVEDYNTRTGCNLLQKLVPSVYYA